MLRSTLIVAILICAGCATIGKVFESDSRLKCDSFSLGDYEVIVKFYDPIDLAKVQFPNFDFNSPKVSDKEKGEKWNHTLHQSTLYLFTLKDKNGNVKKHFCLRGDPNIQDSARFYQAVMVSGEALETFNPNEKSYDQWIERTFYHFPASGMLFEHMKRFKDPSQHPLIGNGVQHFGKHTRVMPYEEVKKGMIKIIHDEIWG